MGERGRRAGLGELGAGAGGRPQRRRKDQYTSSPPFMQTPAQIRQVLYGALRDGSGPAGSREGEDLQDGS